MNKRSLHKPIILLHIEDPGAANGLLPIARKLQNMGCLVEIDLEGFAKDIKGEDLRQLKQTKNVIKNLEEKKYEALITGTSENINSNSFALINKCHNLKIPSFGFIDSPANSENRFSGGGSDPLKFAPNFLIVVDESTVTNFKSFGFADENILNVDHPHLETIFLRKQNLIKTSKDDLKDNIFGPGYRDKFIITFCSELSSGLDPHGYKKNDEYTLQSPKHLLNRTDVVIFNLIEAINTLSPRIDSSLKLVLRLHPKQDRKDLILDKKFDFISKQEPTTEVCLASDLVIGMSSMIMVEAFELGLPVISILPREIEIDWIHSSIRDRIEICTDFSDLLLKLENLFNDTSKQMYKDKSPLKIPPKDNKYIDFIIDNIRDFRKQN